MYVSYPNYTPGCIISQKSPDEQFEFVGVQSESGVGDQPFNESIEKGARNRVVYVKQLHPDADFWIGQEGGVLETGSPLLDDHGIIIVEDKSGVCGRGITATFPATKKLSQLIRGGMELGPATDEVFGLVNTKHSSGLIGVLTDGLIDRTALYLQGAIIAIMQIKHKEWYF